MNYDFDFNINNYNIKELEQFLNINDNYDLNDINEKCSKMILVIKDSKTHDNNYKKSLGKFLDEVKVKLISNIKKISEENDGFIEDYDKPVIDNKITSELNIKKYNNVGKIVTPMTSHQPLQKISMPSDSTNPYGGNQFISNYVFNTQFRDNFFSTTPENCTFTLPVKLKNVISITLSAVQIPNVFFTYSDFKGTNQLYIFEETTNLEAIIVIPPGNYDITTFPTVLEKAINTQLIGSWPNRFEVSIDPYTYFTTISNTTNTFRMNILKKDLSYISSCNYSKYFNDSNPDNIITKNNINSEPSNFCNTMGYLIGYRQIEYEGQLSYTSESMFNSVGNSEYIYFCMNDYVGSQYMQNYGVLPKGLIDDNILAVIPITSPKFTSTFSDNNLQVTTIYDNTMPYAPNYNINI